MKKSLIYLATAIGILLTSHSCKKEPNGGVPIYLKIDSVSLNTTNTQGSASQKITDVWVTANGKPIGAFQLPAKIPILASGDVRLIISAGIKDNGIANTRVEYPFYAIDEHLLSNAQSGEVYTYTPQFTYGDFANFSYKEDFEASNSFTKVNAVNGASEDVFEGNSSGKITLTSSDSILTAYNTNGFTIPVTGREVYLEMNYKCDNYFEMGLLSVKSGALTETYKITLSPKTSWNKIYINLSNEVGLLQADSYRLYYRLVQFTAGSGVNVSIDNLKIVNY